MQVLVLSMYPWKLSYRHHGAALRLHQSKGCAAQTPRQAAPGWVFRKYHSPCRQEVLEDMPPFLGGGEMIEVMTHQFSLALMRRLLSSHVVLQWLPEQACLMVRTNLHPGSALKSR
jgi:hypothetical protein